MPLNPAAKSFVPAGICASVSFDTPVSVEETEDFTAYIGNIFEHKGIARLRIDDFGKYLNRTHIHDSTPRQQAYEQYRWDHQRYLILTIAAALRDHTAEQVWDLHDQLMHSEVFKKLGVTKPIKVPRYRRVVEEWTAKSLMRLKTELRNVISIAMGPHWKFYDLPKPKKNLPIARPTALTDRPAQGAHFASSSAQMSYTGADNAGLTQPQSWFVAASSTGISPGNRPP